MKKVLVILIILVVACSFIFAARATEPTLIKKLNTALGKIKTWLVKLALPASGVGIAVGVFVRKFSFGDEQKLAVGKKIIVNSIVGYGMILCIDMILKTIEALVK